jgi:DmsE family decaheme c-type cytochrome
MNKYALIVALVVVSLVLSAQLIAQEDQTQTSPGAATAVPAPEPTTAEPADATPVLASQYTDKGADTCIKCHDDESKFPVFSIFKTKHAQLADKRSPFANLQCESCHGPGANHARKVRPDQKQAPILSYGLKSPVPAKQQNAMCLSCHEDQKRIAWMGSAHERRDIPCVSCHKVHAEHDQVRAKSEQPKVCFTCHKEQRADFHKPSTHPVRFGQMACSECHNTHGSAAQKALLDKPTLNQTCYGCHAEKRGPFLWEHAPVAEDCALCHTPHGSVNPALLSKRPPLLCQQCHSQAGHPSVASTTNGLSAGSSISPFLLGSSCLNCHTQIHGSNHPSGVKLMR